MCDLETECDSKAANPRLADWITCWIDEMSGLTPSIVFQYRQFVQRQIEPHQIGRLPLIELTSNHITTWLRDLNPQACDNDQQPIYDARSADSILAVMCAALDAAVDQEWIARNPCRDIELVLNSEHGQRLNGPQPINMFIHADEIGRESASDKEEQSQQGTILDSTTPAAENCEFSQIDFTASEIRRSLQQAYGVLLKYRSRLRGTDTHSG